MVIQNIGSSVGGMCNLVLLVGLFAMSATSIDAIPIQTSATSTVGGGGGGGVGVKYPINIACECIFTLYVDGVYVVRFECIVVKCHIV
jgi:hypothetical protein